MEQSVPVVDKQGNEVGTMDIPPQWLEAERGGQAVHETVVAYLADRRAGTASTKTRAEVRGGGRKPYRQKGTGRARAGTIRSPIWGGGGVVFGPKPRSYHRKVNRKVRNLACRRILHDRLRDGELIVLDKLELSAPRTKEMVGLLNAIGAGEHTLLVDAHVDRAAHLATRNLPNAEIVAVDELSAYQMMRYRRVVFTQTALETFGAAIDGTKRTEVAENE